jgi:CubicO group peptidase (beta-lactamase class C family)
MEIAPLKLKLVNGFHKYISGGENNLPLFFGNDISEFKAADTLEKLVKLGAVKTGDVSGLNRQEIAAFIQKLTHDRNLSVSGVGMMYEGKLVALYHHKPYSDEYRHVSYSMCKSVTQMAVGIAWDKGLLKLDERLCDIFPEHKGVFMKKGMKELNIEHLLTMRAGVKFDEVSSFFHFDWCKSYMGSDLAFAPGEDFTYNSLNTYMLAAVIKEKTGKYMLDFLQENLFDYMDIHDITWDKCPKGIERGGWGLKLSLIDMLKLGQLYVDNGCYDCNGNPKQLISREWLKMSVTEHTKFNDKNALSGYAYQIWTLKDGAYLFNGVFGQNVYINTKNRLVIATISSAYEVFPDGKLVDMICKFANSEKLYKKDNLKDNLSKIIRNFKSGKAVDKGLVYDTQGAVYDFYRMASNSKVTGFVNRKKDNQAYAYMHNILAPYLDTEYTFSQYATSIMPITTQVMYAIYNIGISAITLSFEDKKLFCTIEDTGVVYKIMAGYSDSRPYEYQLITVGGKELPIAVHAGIVLDEDNRQLLLVRIVYLEEVSNKVLKIYLDRDEITLSAHETPNMMEFADKLIGEDKMRRTKKLGKTQAMDFLKYRVSRFFSASVTGKIKHSEDL